MLRARDVSLKMLRDEQGIDDVMTVKLRRLTNETWLAQYRGYSQFGGRPIVWINESLHELLDELDRPFDVAVGSILHEYGHIIAEWGKVRNREITELIQRGWGCEEDFAEDFMRYVRHDAIVQADVPSAEARAVMKKIVVIYRETVFAE